jgi:hypothetical protein
MVLIWRCGDGDRRRERAARGYCATADGDTRDAGLGDESTTRRAALSATRLLRSTVTSDDESTIGGDGEPQSSSCAARVE